MILVQVPILLSAFRGICLFYIPFSPPVGQSCLPAGTAPPARIAQVSAVQTHDHGMTSSNNLLKPSPKKSLKDKLLSTEVKPLLSTLMHCSPITGHTGSACFQGITHPSSCSFPSPTALPRVGGKGTGHTACHLPQGNFPCFSRKSCSVERPC